MPKLLFPPGLSGQMHGVVLWNLGGLKELASLCDAISEEDLSLRQHGPCSSFKNGHLGGVSTIITWEDGRCSAEFLAQLPRSAFGAIASGFGCASLFWLSRNANDFLGNFTHAGTLADLVVSLLTWKISDDETSLVKMTDHNCASWGYFDLAMRDWETKILQSAQFPERFLPSIVNVGFEVGQLRCGFVDFREKCNSLKRNLNIYLVKTKKNK